MDNLRHIFCELENALMDSDIPSEYFKALRTDGRLDMYYPELKALIDLPQNREYHREGDVWTHTMLVLDEAAKRREIVKVPLGFMISALCHDLGKAVCTSDEDGQIHSYQHETEGLPIVRGLLTRSECSEELIGYVLNMTELHMKPAMMAHSGSKPKKTNALFYDAKEPFDLIQLSICDGLGKIPRSAESEDFLMQRYELFLEMMAAPYVTEKDLADAGIMPGENFSEVLMYAHKLRLAGEEKERSLKQCIAYYKHLKAGKNN